MIKRLFWFLIPAVLTMSLPVEGQTPYGEVRIEKGSLRVVREGKTLRYPAGEGPVDIHQNDLLQVGDNARIRLDVEAKATVILGSHAVALIQAWRQQERYGFLKMVYGKARVQTPQTGSEQRFHLTTPVAALSPAGTIWLQIDAYGNGLVVAETGDLIIARQGREQRVGTREMAAILPGRPEAEIRTLTDELLEAMGKGELDAAALIDTASAVLSGEETLAEEGVISPDRLEQNRRREVSPEDPHFDWRQTADEAGVESAKPSAVEQTATPPADSVNAELAKFERIAVVVVDPVTTELGVHFVAEKPPENVFAGFAPLKLPDRFLNLDAKTGWGRESGLISISLEK